jgi:two-component system response regulator HydG
MKSSILVVEDQEEIQLSAKFLLRKLFDQVDVFDHPGTASHALKVNHYDVILLDMNFSSGMTNGSEGLHWLKKFQSIKPQSVIVLMTAYAEVELAIKAIKAGAFDFIIKPWDNQRFSDIIQEAKKFGQCKTNNAQPTDALKSMIGSSHALHEVLRIAEKVAMTEANVLILGENGTGKDLLAEYIHQCSMRRDQPLIKVDLGSLTENLFESELFGHKKGAFTDAKEDKVGRIEMANSGTLFLDEIGNLNSPLQSKLLSAIQHGMINKVGSSKSVHVDFRLICATNADLNDMIAANAFRKDLYYRINTVELKLPPLRERGKDVIEIANHFIKTYCDKYNKPMKTLSDVTEQSMLRYHWPGNIRELQHAVERAVILSDGLMIQPEDLTVAHAGDADDKKEHLMNLEEIELNTIRKALTKHGGVISHAANELGLTRASLYRRLEKYGL